MNLKTLQVHSYTNEFFLAKIRNSEEIFLISRQTVLDSPFEEPKRHKLIKKQPASSLRKICCSILKMYVLQQNVEICLKKLAQDLHTERRRVYDIVNILEAFDVLMKKAKNKYIWKGLEEFKNKLVILRNDLSDPLSKVFNFEFRPIRSKKKMLTYMSLKVLRFFSAYKNSINFAEIVKLCLCKKENEEFIDEKQASTTRRLYDIVNVLSALGLISKVYNSQSKKLYRWNGEEGMTRHIKKHYTQNKNPCQKILTDENEDTVFVSIENPKEQENGNHENLAQSRQVRQNSGDFIGFQLCKDFKKSEHSSLKRLLSFSDE